MILKKKLKFIYLHLELFKIVRRKDIFNETGLRQIFISKNKRVMIQPQTLVQIYFVQTDVA